MALVRQILTEISALVTRCAANKKRGSGYFFSVQMLLELNKDTLYVFHIP